MSKITVYDKNEKPVTVQGRVKTLHAVTAASWVRAMPDKWVLITETQKFNGKTKTVTTGIRPKLEKDRQADRVSAKEALESAKRAVEDAESALDSQGDTEDVEAPKGSRKATVRVSSK